MTLRWLVEFVGLATIYAALSSLLILGIAHRLHWAKNWRAAPLMLITFFFAFLTQHPFPVPHELKCPVPSAYPQTHPFNFWHIIVTLHQGGTGATGWLTNKTILATMMNFLVCAAIGSALARHTARIWIALAFGVVLSMSIELTQLTGVWGLYPCAYRQFNVDDLLLNILGVIAGFVMLRAIPFLWRDTEQHD